MSPTGGTRSRTGIIAGLAFSAAITAASIPAHAAGPSDSLAALLTEAVSSFPGSASVIVADPRSAFRFAWHADRIVPSASLYKLGVMVEAYRQSAMGLVSLDGTTVDVTEEDAADEDYYTPPGTTLTLREAIERMITLSDNTPARALLRLLGTRPVNKTLTLMGLRDTRINNGLGPEEQMEPYNTTTAIDMEHFFIALYRGTVVGPAASAEMLGILERQKIGDRLPAGLPEGTVLAHKTGDLDAVSHDAGIIYTPEGPRIAVVLTTDYQSADDVIALNERIASLTYAAQLDDFAARYLVVSGPRLPAPPGTVAWTIQITNPGSFTWDDTTYLRIRLQAATSMGTDRIGRIELPPLERGKSASVGVTVADLRPGIYLLELDVYDEDLGTSGNRFPIVFEVRP